MELYNLLWAIMAIGMYEMNNFYFFRTVRDINLLRVLYILSPQS